MRCLVVGTTAWILLSPASHVAHATEICVAGKVMVRERDRHFSQPPGEGLRVKVVDRPDMEVLVTNGQFMFHLPADHSSGDVEITVYDAQQPRRFLPFSPDSKQLATTGVFFDVPLHPARPRRMSTSELQLHFSEFAAAVGRIGSDPAAIPFVEAAEELLDARRQVVRREVEVTVLKYQTEMVAWFDWCRCEWVCSEVCRAVPVQETRAVEKQAPQSEIAELEKLLEEMRAIATPTYRNSQSSHRGQSLWVPVSNSDEPHHRTILPHGPRQHRYFAIPTALRVHGVYASRQAHVHGQSGTAMLRCRTNPQTSTTAPSLSPPSPD